MCAHAGWGLIISVAMYAVNSAQSLVMNYYFFLGLHTALHVKVGSLQHASLETSLPTCCHLKDTCIRLLLPLTHWLLAPGIHILLYISSRHATIIQLLCTRDVNMCMHVYLHVSLPTGGTYHELSKCEMKAKHDDYRCSVAPQACPAHTLAT